MRRALGAGLALLLAADSGRADPATPQLDAAHLQREDAQRIDEHQRQVDANAPVIDAEPLAPPARPPAPDGPVSGYVLLAVGGSGVVLSAALLAASALDDLDSHTTRNTVAAVIGLAAIGAVGAGIGIVISSRRSHATVSLAPAAGPDGFGVAAVGKF